MSIFQRSAQWHPGQSLHILPSAFSVQPLHLICWPKEEGKYETPFSIPLSPSQQIGKLA